MFEHNYRTLILTLILLIKVCVGASQISGETKYINATNGNDQDDGNLPQTAWKSIDKINSLTFNPGDSILFKAGEEWTGRLVLKGSGNENAPIRMDKYGEGINPVINGTGDLYTIYLFNREYWELSNLEITNFNEAEETVNLETWEANNNSVWSEATSVMPKYTESRTRKCAILVEAEDYGTIHHLHFTNLEIHGVNGDISSKDNGGIFFEITGESVQTYFEDLLIENCYIHDVDRTGISNKSTWMNRSLDENSNWVPSKNVQYRENKFERTGANALIIRVTDSALIQKNLFTHCSIKETGNAFFPFNCDNTVIQHNESCYTKYNQGDADAGGFDSDYRCKNTLIQYNYSHHNEHGGILICCQGGSNRFNDGTIIRYNIFQDNGRHVIRVSGVPTNTDIYNNIIFTGAENSDNDIIWHKNWDGYPDLTSYYNNIFYNLGVNNGYDLGYSTNNVFENNIFFGNLTSDEPDDPGKITDDPLLVNPGNEDLNGYMITRDSPACGAGKIIYGQPEIDFFSNPIPPNGPVDIGIHQLSEPVSMRGITIKSGNDSSEAIYLFPNPVHDNLTVDSSHLNSKVMYWRVLDSSGKEIVLNDQNDPGTGSFKFDIKLKDFALEAGIFFLGIKLENGHETMHPFIYY